MADIRSNGVNGKVPVPTWLLVVMLLSGPGGAVTAWQVKPETGLTRAEVVEVGNALISEHIKQVHPGAAERAEIDKLQNKADAILLAVQENAREVALNGERIQQLRKEVERLR